jgi:hypothetical protein
MQHLHAVQSNLFHLAGVIEDLAAGCDTDFDAAYDDLEREFAEVRCQLGNA